ncbi:hypothetical protein GXW82_16670 [Streptacidiphilus sp. 4-A2]|nr:hypothetical protein [Streptacidiphilus sp. 4-A2]
MRLSPAFRAVRSTAGLGALAVALMLPSAAARRPEPRPLLPGRRRRPRP